MVVHCIAALRTVMVPLLTPSGINFAETNVKKNVCFLTGAITYSVVCIGGGDSSFQLVAKITCREIVTPKY